MCFSHMVVDTPCAKVLPVVAHFDGAPGLLCVPRTSCLAVTSKAWTLTARPSSRASSVREARLDYLRQIHIYSPGGSWSG